MWQDRRIYGPWRDHVTPTASRRAFWFPTPIKEKDQISDGGDSLPEFSGSQIDSLILAQHGGMMPKSSGIWSEQSIPGDDLKFKLRLARAWQRKSERFWMDLKNSVKAVVFTDSPDTLNLPLAGVGWGLNLLRESGSSTRLYKPFIYGDNRVPSKVLEVRKWLKEVCFFILNFMIILFFNTI